MDQTNGETPRNAAFQSFPNSGIVPATSVNALEAVQFPARRGERRAIRPLDNNGQYGIFFAARRIANIDLTNPAGVGDVSEQVSAMSAG
jgi:hypothetical protein